MNGWIIAALSIEALLVGMVIICDSKGMNWKYCLVCNTVEYLRRRKDAKKT